MPSIQDVADQINAKLDQINQNTGNTAANTAAIQTVAEDIRGELVQANGHLVSIDNHIQAGLANVAQGIYALFELQKVAVALLDHHRQQNDTIICELTNANELLCGITRKFTEQLELSGRSLAHLERLDGIAERALPAEAGDYDRDLAARKRIEECCPPEQPEPEPCPEDCGVPEYRPQRPDGQDWHPLPTPTVPQPPRAAGKKRR